MKLVAVLLLSMLSACASLQTESLAASNLRRAMDKWVGRSADDLLAAKGAPPDVFMLDSGGRMFGYFKSQLVGGNSESAESMRGKHYVVTGYDPSGNPIGQWVEDNTSGLRQKVRNPKDNTCKIFFTVAANNAIQSWSKEGDGCD